MFWSSKKKTYGNDCNTCYVMRTESARWTSDRSTVSIKIDWYALLVHRKQCRYLTATRLPLQKIRKMKKARPTISISLSNQEIAIQSGLPIVPAMTRNYLTPVAPKSTRSPSFFSLPVHYYLHISKITSTKKKSSVFFSSNFLPHSFDNNFAINFS